MHSGRVRPICAPLRAAANLRLAHGKALDGQFLLRGRGLKKLRAVHLHKEGQIMSSQSNLVQVPIAAHSLQTVMARESFGVRIGRMRRRRGLTLEHVANALGVSKPTVWAWEKGKCRPQPARIAAIAELLGAEVDDLDVTPLSTDSVQEVIENCRQRIASACGTSSAAVRILVEL